MYSESWKMIYTYIYINLKKWIFSHAICSLNRKWYLNQYTRFYYNNTFWTAIYVQNKNHIKIIWITIETHFIFMPARISILEKKTSSQHNRSSNIIYNICVCIYLLAGRGLFRNPRFLSFVRAHTTSLSLDQSFRTGFKFRLIKLSTTGTRTRMSHSRVILLKRRVTLNITNDIMYIFL